MVSRHALGFRDLQKEKAEKSGTVNFNSSADKRKERAEHRSALMFFGGAALLVGGLLAGSHLQKTATKGDADASQRDALHLKANKVLSSVKLWPSRYETFPNTSPGAAEGTGCVNYTAEVQEDDNPFGMKSGRYRVCIEAETKTTAKDVQTVYKPSINPLP
jgi:hypothetical protein